METLSSCYIFDKHRGGPFKPKKIVVDEKKEYYLCGCKFTHNENGKFLSNDLR